MNDLALIEERDDVKSSHNNVPLSPLQRPHSIFENYGSLINHLPKKIVRDAWFTMAHLVIEPGSEILKVGCDEGTLTYAMAAMNPQHQFVGIDKSRKKIKRAQKNFSLPNLKFISGDIQENFIQKNSLDAVINAFSLHEFYSDSHCNERLIQEMLSKQIELLKPDGRIFIRDYAMPSPENYVMLEIPDEPTGSDDPVIMSDAELLLSYSETARTRQDLDHCGFYLEELPPRFPKTRLFRLPHKWAYEFIMRKDKREEWDKELHKEYTFYTERDFRKVLRGLGTRVLYTAPHWDEQTVRKKFDKKFKIFDDDGVTLGAPSTSFIAVAQKMNNKKSLILQERRPVRTEQNNVRIIAMRDDYEGKIMDIVSRDVKVTEILPYRVTEQGRLHVFVHEGIPRSILNTVSRNTPNIDGKKWSGHMTEAIAIDSQHFDDVDPVNFKSVVLFAKNFLGLKPKVNHVLEDGPGFYPAPDCIDELIETKYLYVEQPKGSIVPKHILAEIDGFSTKGIIRELDAQTILNAIGVGVIPSSRLEVQILGLLRKLGIAYESWSQSPLTLEEYDPPNVTKLQEIIAKLAAEDHRFKEVRGTAGQLKAQNSVFVDEGQQNGGITGLASRELEFVMHEERTNNMAVVLPLARKTSGEVMAGISERYLPVPQRYKGNGYVVSCPSFPLPPDITNFELARKYIADKFEADLECVARMGESYFSHIGIMPQRIYPFVVTPNKVSGWRKDGRVHGVTNYAPLYHLCDILYLDNYYSFMKIAAEAFVFMQGQVHSPEMHFSTSMAAERSNVAGLSGEVVSSAPTPSSSSDNTSSMQSQWRMDP